MAHSRSSAGSFVDVQRSDGAPTGEGVTGCGRERENPPNEGVVYILLVAFFMD